MEEKPPKIDYCPISEKKKPPETTSTSMLYGLQRDDEQQWKRFVEIYTALIRAWIQRPDGILRSEDEEDIIQSVFMKVNKSIINFDIDLENRSFRAWLRKITQNTIIDFLKSIKNRQNFVRLMPGTNQLENLAESMDVFFDESDEKTERAILMQEILKFVQSRYTEEQREIFNLFINAEKTSSEVAEIMNMKPDTVRKIKNRMLKEIHQECRDLGLDEDFHKF